MDVLGILMNGAYNFNLYIKTTFSGSFEWPLYTGLTVYVNRNIGPFGYYIVQSCLTTEE